MHLLILIFGITLFPTAFTLKCNRCLPQSSGRCTNSEVVCPSSVMYDCAAIRITPYAGDSKLTSIHMRACIPEEDCVETSVNFGVSRNVITSTCCNTDLCNNRTAPEPSQSEANGKKCYYCDGQRCSATLNCKGTEDHCFSKSVLTGGEIRVTKGCISNLMCTNMGHSQIRAALGGEITCCQGDFCNSATTTSAGLLLLMAPLVTLVMLS